jgi:hypothetical protein
VEGRLERLERLTAQLLEEVRAWRADRADSPATPVTVRREFVSVPSEHGSPLRLTFGDGHSVSRIAPASGKLLWTVNLGSKQIQWVELSESSLRFLVGEWIYHVDPANGAVRKIELRGARPVVHPVVRVLDHTEAGDASEKSARARIAELESETRRVRAEYEEKLADLSRRLEALSDAAAPGRDGGGK